MTEGRTTVSHERRGEPVGMQSDKRQWWGVDHALIWSVASWAVEMGELSSADEVIAFWEKPWKYPELHREWELNRER